MGYRMNITEQRPKGKFDLPPWFIWNKLADILLEIRQIVETQCGGHKYGGCDHLQLDLIWPNMIQTDTAVLAGWCVCRHFYNNSRWQVKNSFLNLSLIIKQASSLIFMNFIAAIGFLGNTYRQPFFVMVCYNSQVHCALFRQNIKARTEV